MNYWYNIDLNKEDFYVLPKKKKFDDDIRGFASKNKRTAVRDFIKKIYELKGATHNSQLPLQWTISDKKKLDKVWDVAYAKYFDIYPELFI